MNKILVSLSILVILSAVSCSQKGTENTGKPIIVVSIEPQRKLLTDLAGNRFDIATMLATGSDPETFDPSMATRLKADNSIAYFSTGVFPFEEKIHNSLSDSTEYIDLSKGISILHGTHGHECGGHHHSHDDADPHIWTSIANMKIMAANMAGALARLDPPSAALYSENLSKLSQRLDSLDAAIRQKLENARNSFVVWHPSLSYFAKDYNLNQISVGSESKEMPPAKLRQVIDTAKNSGAKVFFSQKEFDSRQIDGINRAIGSRIVEIQPMDYDWENELTHIADELTRP